MDIKQVYELIHHMEGSGLTELDLEMEGVKLHLKKENTGGTDAASSHQMAFRNREGEDEVSRNSVFHQKSKAEDHSSMDYLKANESGYPEVKTPDYLEVKAPLVGTFNRSPQPDAEPFVKEGQSLRKGDVIGIIEAMKLMNEITAPADGVVVKICVEDGDMVEYDSPLILISEA